VLTAADHAEIGRALFGFAMFLAIPATFLTFLRPSAPGATP
jgi:hypothetical protein